jgi:hypothetical protein
MWVPAMLLLLGQDLRPQPLPSIRRVYVDRFTGGETAAQMRELIIAALEATKLFVLTENPDRADATLRGAAEDLVFTDQFSSSESAATSRRGAASRREGLARGVAGALGSAASESETVNIRERKHEAMATVRLVNREGDVIWATTQESLGGKFRGAAVDVADKIARQLAADYQRGRGK